MKKLLEAALARHINWVGQGLRKSGSGKGIRQVNEELNFGNYLHLPAGCGKGTCQASVSRAVIFNLFNITAHIS